MIIISLNNLESKTINVYTKDIHGVSNMLIKVRKIGNSLVSSLPKQIISKTNFIENSLAEVIVQDQDTIVLKLKKDKKLYLESLFENYDGADDPKEYSWDDIEPIGKEIW